MNTQQKGIFLLIIAGFLMTGCGAGQSKQEKLDQDKQEDFIKSLPKVDIVDVLWDRDLGSFNTIGFNYIIDDGVSYSMDAKGQLLAIDISNGDIVWKKKYKREITAAIGVSTEMLFAVDEKSRLVAFSRRDGEQLWRSDINAKVFIPPVVAGKTVIVKTLDARLIGFDLNSGDQLWTYRHEKTGLSLRGGSTPLVARNFLFTGFEDGRLVAVDAINGKLLWDVPVGKSSGRDEIQRLTDIDAQPVIAGDHLYVAAFQRRIMALDIVGGRILWSRPVSSFLDFSLDSQTLYVIEDTNKIIAMDRESGNVNWIQEDLKDIPLSSITILGDTLILTDDKSMYALSRRNGDVISREKLSGGSPLVQPVVIDGIAYFLLSNGEFKALALNQ